MQPRCFKCVWAVKTDLLSISTARHQYADGHLMWILNQTAPLCSRENITPMQRGISSLEHLNKKPDKLCYASHKGRQRKTAKLFAVLSLKRFLLGHAAYCRPTLAVCAYGLFLWAFLESLAKHSTDWVRLEKSSFTTSLKAPIIRTLIARSII